MAVTTLGLRAFFVDKLGAIGKNYNNKAII